MIEPNWLVILVLVAALVYGAYLLGRASALSEARRAAGEPAPSPAPVREGSMPQHTPGAAPPPVLAGGDRAPSGPASGTPPRRTAPPPASAAGPASANAGPSNGPKRTAAPPPAQAAWSDPKSGQK